MSDVAEWFTEMTGASVPREYSLIRLLGEGSMGCVFLARNTTLKRLVAIKVLRKELADDPVARKRFVREAQAAARIEHPSVASVYSVRTPDQGAPYIEMQYIDGANLRDYLAANGCLAAQAVCRILGQIASALAAAHEHQVIHRDVEPANILIEQETGLAFLSDFGIAGILETGTETVTKLTQDSERLGSPAYMSPDQLRGEVLTPQSDVYGLGLLGYEMLTMNGPFGPSEIADMAGAHLRRPPVDLHESIPDVPQQLSDVLKRCVSKKPEHRPTAASLAETLEAIANNGSGADVGEPELQGALGSFLRELQARKVYRAAVAYAAAVFVVLQAAELILPPLSAPTWVYRITVIVSLAAFPVVLALAWIFDLEKGRFTRTATVKSTFMQRISPRQLLALKSFGLLLSMGVSGVVAWLLLAS
ncbi:MAG: serine/threonine protein kinase [Gammaproteobacteria bacterium]|nr:serine/threonine protein kinase [Gammaproteobacteria bacterium]MDH3429518.1 serine/threonine protein kinase [Gammaproteobacteria bacterium]MDH3432670.1 serine/threonine protein kinase [Gammaproteobacteria bacterium]